MDLSFEGVDWDPYNEFKDSILKLNDIEQFCHSFKDFEEELEEHLERSCGKDLNYGQLRMTFTYMFTIFFGCMSKFFGLLNLEQVEFSGLESKILNLSKLRYKRNAINDTQDFFNSFGLYNTTCLSKKVSCNEGTVPTY